MASTRGPGFVSGYSYLFCESSALLLAVFLLFEVFAFGYLEPCRFWGKSAHHEPEKVVSRLLPFIVNTMVARRLAPEEFGVPTVHFQLLSTVILTCREGFRRALMRHGDTDARERDANDESQEAAGWLVVPLGAAVSTAVPYFLFTASNLDLEDPYAKAVALYSLAAFLELFSEPFFIRAQRRSHFQLRLLTETVATLARSFVTFYFVTYAATSTAVPLAFAYGQLVYSLCVLLMYALPQLRFAAIGVRLALGEQRLQWGTLALVGTFSTQALWKLVLAESEKGVLIWVGSADSQGVYALVSSLGSLFVRIILQPFEEAAFFAFAKNSVSNNSARAMESRAFNAILKTAILVGMTSALHGPQYSNLALNLLYGKRWADAEGASSILGGFAVMILFLAVNGVSEAFAHAVMSPHELASANLVLLITSAFNVVAAAALQLYVGPLGFILVNCFAMSVRIAYTLCYVQYVRFANCSEHRFIECLPTKETILLFCATSAVTVFTSTLRPFVHLCSGAFVFVVIIGALSRFEASSIGIVRELKNKQD